VKEVRKGTEISHIKNRRKEDRSLINNSETYMLKGYFEAVQTCFALYLSARAQVMHQHGNLYLQIRFADVNLLIIPNH
jgi:hypothetical protein